MAISLIKFTQGTNTDAAGHALLGTIAGGPVTVENGGDNTNTLSWRIELLYAPPESGMPTGVVASNANDANPTFAFTPDATGCYRFRLTVWTGVSYSGTQNVDIRNFAVPLSEKIVQPPYQTHPPTLPIQGSGYPGEKPDELNFGGQPYGWAGDDDPTRKLLHQQLAELNELVARVPAVTNDAILAAVSNIQMSVPLKMNFDDAGNIWVGDGNLLDNTDPTNGVISGPTIPSPTLSRAWTYPQVSDAHQRTIAAVYSPVTDTIFAVRYIGQGTHIHELTKTSPITEVRPPVDLLTTSDARNIITGGGYLWVASLNQVWRVNPSTYYTGGIDVVADGSSTTPAGYNDGALLFIEDTIFGDGFGRFFYTTASDGGIHRFHSDTLVHEASFTMPDTPAYEVAPPAYDPTKGRIGVVYDGSSTGINFVTFDADTLGDNLRSIDLSSYGQQYFSVAYEPVSDTYWIYAYNLANQNGAIIRVQDTGSALVYVDTLDLGVTASDYYPPYYPQLTTYDGYVWVVCLEKLYASTRAYRFLRIDPQTDVVFQIPINSRTYWRAPTLRGDVEGSLDNAVVTRIRGVDGVDWGTAWTTSLKQDGMVPMVHSGRGTISPTFLPATQQSSATGSLFQYQSNDDHQGWTIRRDSGVGGWTAQLRPSYAVVSGSIADSPQRMYMTDVSGRIGNDDHLAANRSGVIDPTAGGANSSYRIYGVTGIGRSPQFGTDSFRMKTAYESVELTWSPDHDGWVITNRYRPWEDVVRPNPVNPSTIMVNSGKAVVHVDTRTAGQSVALASTLMSHDDWVIIKDSYGNAAANNITVDGGPHLIDGVAQVTIDQDYGCYIFRYDAQGDDDAGSWEVLANVGAGGGSGSSDELPYPLPTEERVLRGGPLAVNSLYYVSTDGVDLWLGQSQLVTQDPNGEKNNYLRTRGDGTFTEVGDPLTGTMSEWATVMVLYEPTLDQMVAVQYDTDSNALRLAPLSRTTPAVLGTSTLIAPLFCPTDGVAGGGYLWFTNQFDTWVKVSANFASVTSLGASDTSARLAYDDGPGNRYGDSEGRVYITNSTVIERYVPSTDALDGTFDPSGGSSEDLRGITVDTINGRVWTIYDDAETYRLTSFDCETLGANQRSVSVASYVFSLNYILDILYADGFCYVLLYGFSGGILLKVQDTGSALNIVDSLTDTVSDIDTYIPWYRQLAVLNGYVYYPSNNSSSQPVLMRTDVASLGTPTEVDLGVGLNWAEWPVNVAASNSDTVPDKLYFKIDPDESFELDILNPGGNEKLHFRSLASVLGTFVWDFDSSTVMSDPGTTDFRFNNSNWASATQLALDDQVLTHGTFLDVGRLVQNWVEGDRLLVRSVDNNSNRYGIFEIGAGGPMDQGGWWLIPVSHLQGSTFTASFNERFFFYRTSAGNGGGGGPGSDTTAIHRDTSAEISTITEKTTPAGTDLLIIEDSAAANAKKRVQIANLPSSGGADPVFGGNSALRASDTYSGRIHKLQGGGFDLTGGEPRSIVVDYGIAFSVCPVGGPNGRGTIVGFFLGVKFDGSLNAGFEFPTQAEGPVDLIKDPSNAPGAEFYVACSTTGTVKYCTVLRWFPEPVSTTAGAVTVNSTWSVGTNPSRLIRCNTHLAVLCNGSIHRIIDIHLGPFVVTQDSIAVTGAVWEDAIYDGNYLWALDSNANLLRKIDINGSTMSEVSSVSVTTITGKGNLAFDGAAIWHCRGESSFLERVDVASGSVTSLSIGDIGSYSSRAVAFDGEALWVYTSTPSPGEAVFTVDPISGQVREREVTGATAFDTSYRHIGMSLGRGQVTFMSRASVRTFRRTGGYISNADALLIGHVGRVFTGFGPLRIRDGDTHDLIAEAPNLRFLLLQDDVTSPTTFKFPVGWTFHPTQPTGVSEANPGFLFMYRPADASGEITINGYHASGPAFFDSTETLAPGEVALVFEHQNPVTQADRVMWKIPDAGSDVPNTVTVDAGFSSKSAWNPTGWGSAEFVRITSGAAVDISGWYSEVTHYRKKLVNVGSFAITLKHATGPTAYQMLITGSADLVLQPNDMVDITRDVSSLRWRVG